MVPSQLSAIASSRNPDPWPVSGFRLSGEARRSPTATRQLLPLGRCGAEISLAVPSLAPSQDTIGPSSEASKAGDHRLGMKLVARRPCGAAGYDACSAVAGLHRRSTNATGHGYANPRAGYLRSWSAGCEG